MPTGMTYTLVKVSGHLHKRRFSTEYHFLTETKVPPVQALGAEGTVLESVEVVSARGAKAPRVCMRVFFLPKRLA